MQKKADADTQMMCQCKFGQNPSVPSGDRVQVRADIVRTGPFPAILGKGPWPKLGKKST